jgi:hypothetical protein
MGHPSEIDTTFDFRDDTPEGRDPDQYSPTLRRYHKLLWSKPLPSGVIFELADTERGCYLHHQSDLGQFFLSSDAVIHTYWNWIRPKQLAQTVAQIPDADVQSFRRIGYTIGGMMIFPGNQIDRCLTLNQARGLLTTTIGDRLDLTLECIRRHYLGQTSPLADVLWRYGEFFALYGDFRGYVDFFLLQDLTTTDYDVKFFLPFANFTTPAVPLNVAQYTEYRQRSINFVQARNQRIASTCGLQR